ncbi:MAG: lysine--tRNA ligase [Planctomycetota bacterium]
MSDQISDRRAKLAKLREMGVDPFGARYESVASHAAIRAAADGLKIAAGQVFESAEACFRAAGRVVLHRDIGSLIFLTVRDRTGDLQYGISKKMLAEGLEGARGPGAQGGERGTENGEQGTGNREQGTGSIGVPPVRHGTGTGEHAMGNRGAGVGDAGAAVPTFPPSHVPTFPRSPAPPQTAWPVAKLLDLGDIIGVEGRLGRTKTGELTLWCTSLTLLSKSLRPPPPEWYGLKDVELRYRRRYVDLYANPASRDVFVRRARIIDHIRRVLRDRGFIEVDTPVLQPIYGGAAARPFVTHHNTLDMRLYLRISPELYLKRCLVGGLERVYELARCFRNEGISPRHNPEFTMLELYQAYGDYHDMMDICEAIIGGAARDVIGSTRIAFGDREIDYTTPWPRRKYADLFAEHVGVPLTDIAAVRVRARALKIEEQKLDDAVVVNKLFEHYVEPHLVNPTFVVDYPAPLCPLTKRHPADPSLALRFELYINGMELGNAYSELNDPDVQRENLTGQVAGEGDETMRVMDEDFCEALEYGMPPAGGLGIGIDRLVMLLTGSPSIRDVLLFPLQRPQT